MDRQRHHPWFKLFSGILLSLLLVGLIAATLNFVRRLPGAASGQSNPPSPTPDCRVVNPYFAISGTLDPGVAVRLIDSTWPCTVALRVRESHVIAEAVITAIEPLRFDTSDGRPPTASPSETESVFDLEEPPRLLRAVVLDVQRVFSGTSVYSSTEVAGYVVDLAGGEYPDCMYAYRRSEPILTGGIGDKGMVFLREPSDDWFNDPPGWFQVLIDVANAWSRPGHVYRPVTVYRWYRYDLATGTAESPPCPSLPVSELIAAVETALGR